MKSTFYFISLLILNLAFRQTDSQLTIQNYKSIRPIRDNIGFCWKAKEMDSFVNYLSKNFKEKNFPAKNLVAAISVHDDYLYAGKIYFPLYKLIKTKEVVIFGVTHGTVRKEMGNLSNVLILDEFDKWKGPYKDVEISPLREIIKTKLAKENYFVSNKAHSIEHSIEALIPFLQYYNRDIKITPIMVTQMPFEEMEELSGKLSKIIGDYIKKNNLELGKDIFFLMSNDANHYGEDFNNSPYGMDEIAHKLATENDKRILSQCLDGEIIQASIKKLTTEIWPDSTNKKTIPIWCGRYPVTFGLLTVDNILKEFSNSEMLGRLFKYSDTFSEKVLPVKNTSMGLTAVFSYRHWCAWFTEGIYLK